MNHENANWGQSVAGVVVHEGKVLLVRHTYGVRKGRLIVPGGYVNMGEMPMDAVKREVYEETHVNVEPIGVVGIRFNQKDWYVAFKTRYISGEAVSDHAENSEVIWMDVATALKYEDVPDLTRKLIQCAVCGNIMTEIPYDGTDKYGPYALFGAAGNPSVL